MEPNAVSPGTTTPVSALDKKLSGFTAGTLIITADGLIPVEHLTPGDRVVTRDAGMQRVTWIDAVYATTAAVRIVPCALGHAKPEERVTLPEGQRLLVRGWRAQTLYGAPLVGVPVWRMAAGQFIRRLGPRSLRLFRVGFEQQHTVYVGGLEMLAHTKGAPRP
ncbi:MAG: Hint domain-containing protein [Pseudomonadota bacterium]